MRSVAFPNPRGWRSLGSGLLLLSLASASPALAQPRRPGPEILSAKPPLGDPIRILVGQPVTVIGRARVCGTPESTPAEAEAVGMAVARWRDEHLQGAPAGTIRLAVHVITDRGEGDVTAQRIDAQIAELNRGFAGSGYAFVLASVDRTDDAGWFRMSPGSTKEHKAKQALAIDPAHTLNLYTCSPAQDLRGWASLPWSAPESDVGHGVVLDHASLPGGEATGDAGRTALHEVGHYLGLVHADEPAGDRALPGPAQVARMREIVPVYRPSLFNAPMPPATSPEISPEAGAEPDEGRLLAFRGAFPNPFRAEALLRFTLPMSQPVSLKIYSVTGQLVRTLVDAPLPPGDHSAMFRADGLPSGAYFALLRVGQVQMSRTLMLVR